MNDQLEKLFGPNFKLKEITTSQSNNLMGILSGNVLESNKVFSYLRSELELYYKELKIPVKFQTLLAHQSPVWKEKLFSTLQTLLNEIVFTVDPFIQDSLITKVYSWYAEKTHRAIKVYHQLLPQKIKDPISYPYIPQTIEKVTPPEASVFVPKMPKKTSFSLSESESFYSGPGTAGATIFTPMLKRRSKYHLRLSCRPKDNPTLIDFRSSSVGNETMRTTNFTEKELKKPLTAQVSAPRVEQSTRDQMTEVLLIKKSLARKNMTMPIRILESGLVFSNMAGDPLPVRSLPKGGEMLLHDPSNRKTPKKKRKRGKK